MRILLSIFSLAHLLDERIEMIYHRLMDRLEQQGHSEGSALSQVLALTRNWSAYDRKCFLRNMRTLLTSLGCDVNQVGGSFLESEKFMGYAVDEALEIAMRYGGKYPDDVRKILKTMLDCDGAVLALIPKSGQKLIEGTHKSDNEKRYEESCRPVEALVEVITQEENVEDTAGFWRRTFYERTQETLQHRLSR